MLALLLFLVLRHERTNDLYVNKWFGIWYMFTLLINKSSSSVVESSTHFSSEIAHLVPLSRTDGMYSSGIPNIQGTY